VRRSLRAPSARHGVNKLERGRARVPSDAGYGRHQRLTFRPDRFCGWQSLSDQHRPFRSATRSPHSATNSASDSPSGNTEVAATALRCEMGSRFTSVWWPMSPRHPRSTRPTCGSTTLMHSPTSGEPRELRYTGPRTLGGASTKVPWWTPMAMSSGSGRRSIDSVPRTPGRWHTMLVMVSRCYV